VLAAGRLVHQSRRASLVAKQAGKVHQLLYIGLRMERMSLFKQHFEKKEYTGGLSTEEMKRVRYGFYLRDDSFDGFCVKNTTTNCLILSVDLKQKT